ncbi:primosomal replication protein [Pseudoalteromonas tunicata]|jgi:primosomal replication protein N''|uniref:Primosomal replication protein N n=2 Tax=Pseudoalteromonas tunicata TaxID=314281 RepID=A4C5S2_9GAMM|nr:primosomal replication protein [Pseudoalteromonas tunicata]ATC95301.1 primosomal replication protein N'' [Pseudoalteromonas tunicata]AXT30901.1 primosomal protein [Pseudoalteromonas tunicata]EAR29326.1 hypothetical protein PTD2_10939 [Pseudoalteromonas tunicata D2]MDP4984166.1 primosomal replication protein [Pseudoalteromonas tunicata]
MSLTVIERLEAQITRLKHDAKAFDNAKLLEKNRFIQNKHRLFDPHLFSSKSMLLLDYVDEIGDALKSMPNIAQRNSYTFAVEKISLQLEAIVRVLKATPVWAKENQPTRKKYYKKAVQQIMQSSHELYKELSDHHEFERRLNEMVSIRRLQLDKANSEQANKINLEILAIHGRLGRCRKAISAIEDKIQRAEKVK